MPGRIKCDVASRVLEKAVEERLRRFIFPLFFEIRSGEDEARAKGKAERLKKLRAGSDRRVAAVFVCLGGYRSHQDEQGG